MVSSVWADVLPQSIRVLIHTAHNEVLIICFMIRLLLHLDIVHIAAHEYTVLLGRKENVAPEILKLVQNDFPLQAADHSKSCVKYFLVGLMAQTET